MSDTLQNGQPEPRPYISRLEVSGFKSIRHANIELGRLNVLIGANGSGKSNLAAMFRMLSAYADQSLASYVARAGGANAILHFGAKRTARIEIAATFMEPSPTNSWLTLAHNDVDRLLIEREWSEGVSATRLVNAPYLESRLVNYPEWSHIAKTLRNIAICHFNDTSSESRLRLTGDIDDNVQLRSDGRNLAAFLYKLQEVWADEFKYLTKVVKLVAPFFDRFVLRPVEQNPRTIILRWREVGADEDFGAHLLSDGTLRFIAQAALLTQPKDKLPPLVFLDEPEIGLHPFAITSLAGLIKRAARNTQIILATQSPDLLNHFDPGHVIVAERHDDGTEFKRPDPAALTEWLEDYSLGELWDKNVIGGRPTR